MILNFLFSKKAKELTEEDAEALRKEQEKAAFYESFLPLFGFSNYHGEKVSISTDLGDVKGGFGYVTVVDILDRSGSSVRAFNFSVAKTAEQAVKNHREALIKYAHISSKVPDRSGSTFYKNGRVEYIS